MKKHRFCFSKESKERVESFSASVEMVKRTEETPAPENRQADEKAGLEIVARTDIGRVRASNQDAVIVCERLCGVADGMGGHNGGETASSGARDQLVSLLRGREPDPLTLMQAVKAANRHLFQQQAEDESLQGMGTTLTVLWVGPESIYTAHVGDSRAYLLRDGEMKQVTDDHSMVMELVRAGAISREQAEVHPMKNVITRAVGSEETVEVDMLSTARKPGDLWLVCSDGLHGLVSEENMRRILTENEPAKAADLLIASALEAGGRDNVSLVILVDREGEK